MWQVRKMREKCNISHYFFILVSHHTTNDHKSLDKSLMIGYNLERFANSPANIVHVTLYFNNLVQKWDIDNICQWFSIPWDIFSTPSFEYMHVQVDA